MLTLLWDVRFIKMGLMDFISRLGSRTECVHLHLPSKWPNFLTGSVRTVTVSIEI